MKKISIKLLAAFFLMMLVTQPAYAAFINEWSYSLSYELSDYTNEAGTQDGMTLDLTPTGYDGWTLTWGVDALHPDGSSIGSVDKTGNVTTNSSTTIEAHLFHLNKPISASTDSLMSGKLSATLTLQGYNPYSDTVATFSTVLEFLFFETSNNSEFSNTNDLFILLNPEAASQTFMYDDWEYSFSFLNGIDPINPDSLTAMHMGPPATGGGYASVWDLLQTEGSPYYYVPESGLYFGWETPEDTLTLIDSELTVTGTPPVPEPSTFIIFGLGIATLAFVGRRMQRKQ
ncbi:THxN family PEP-CTERM protein [Pseudodesulfovibrio thermohalotolerans]|nr:THxN family PEP-CTERM protein [Pseudodesulfovibrio thermohalotolerans]